MSPTEDVRGEGFEVVGRDPPTDRRGEAAPRPEGSESCETGSESTLRGPEGQPADEEPAPEAAQAEPSAAEQPRPLDVYAVLRVVIAQLAAVAWQLMGLQADPFTNTIRKDIEQARIAIDATAGLAEKLLPQLEGQELRDYQNLLTDLRMNFLRQAGSEQ